MSLIERHLDAISASVALLTAQIDAARHALRIAAPAQAGQAAVTLPARCVGIPEAQCVLRDDAAGRQVMGGVTVCVGCQERLTSEIGR